MASDSKFDLSNLTKIHPNEFEQQFREWIERDDVARSLQAKLRSDLITNFNKTALGKQIFSQSSPLSGPYGHIQQRFTLSPLLLALNTLVAEYLYAHNCHFTLSVYCTEVPFRTTLPDFENIENFRFTEMEIIDMFEAITSNAKSKPFISRIAYKYSRNTNASLLLIVLRMLLENESHKPLSKGVDSVEQCDLRPPVIDKGTSCNLDDFERPNDETFNCSSVLYEFLTQIGKRMNSITKYFASLTNNSEICLRSLRRYKMHRPLKSGKKFNRNFERYISAMNQLPIKNNEISFPMKTLIKKINKIGKMFQKCSNSFEFLIKLIDEDLNRNDNKSFKSKGTQTENCEKTYGQWIEEMRTTRNGKKFLNKVDVALTKAMKNQKQQIHSKLEQKIRRQREIFKIRYKYKEQLNKELSKDILSEASNATDHRSDNLTKQTKSIEKHKPIKARLLRDCNQDFYNNREKRTLTPTSEHHYMHPIENSFKNTVKKTNENALVTNSFNLKKKHDSEQAKGQNDLHVNESVNNARKYLQLLESESNLIEEQMTDYLKRQRSRMHNQQKSIRKKMGIQINQLALHNRRYRKSLPKHQDKDNNYDSKEEATSIQSNDEQQTPEIDEFDYNKNCTNLSDYENPILKAKENFFYDRKILLQKDRKNLIGYQNETSNIEFTMNSNTQSFLRVLPYTENGLQKSSITSKSKTKSIFQTVKCNKKESTGHQYKNTVQKCKRKFSSDNKAAKLSDNTKSVQNLIPNENILSSCEELTTEIEDNLAANTTNSATPPPNTIVVEQLMGKMKQLFSYSKVIDENDGKVFEIGKLVEEFAQQNVKSDQ